jgi:hypothetical protein
MRQKAPYFYPTGLASLLKPFKYQTMAEEGFVWAFSIYLRNSEKNLKKIMDISST